MDIGGGLCGEVDSWYGPYAVRVGGGLVPLYLDLVGLFDGADGDASDPHHRMHETEDPTNEDPRGQTPVAKGERDGQADRDEYAERKHQEDRAERSQRLEIREPPPFFELRLRAFLRGLDPVGLVRIALEDFEDKRGM